MLLEVAIHETDFLGHRLRSKNQHIFNWGPWIEGYEDDTSWCKTHNGRHNPSKFLFENEENFERSHTANQIACPLLGGLQQSPYFELDQFLAVQTFMQQIRPLTLTQFSLDSRNSVASDRNPCTIISTSSQRDEAQNEHKGRVNVCLGHMLESMRWV